MGRAAKVQSFFESAMTDFTEQLHCCLIAMVMEISNFSYEDFASTLSNASIISKKTSIHVMFLVAMR